MASQSPETIWLAPVRLVDDAVDAWTDGWVCVSVGGGVMHGRPALTIGGGCFSRVRLVHSDGQVYMDGL